MRESATNLICPRSPLNPGAIRERRDQEWRKDLVRILVHLASCRDERIHMQLLKEHRLCTSYYVLRAKESKMPLLSKRTCTNACLEVGLVYKVPAIAIGSTLPDCLRSHGWNCRCCSILGSSSASEKKHLSCRGTIDKISTIDQLKLESRDSCLVSGKTVLNVGNIQYR